MVYYDVKIKYTLKEELKEQKLKEAFYTVKCIKNQDDTSPSATQSTKAKVNW